MALAFFAATIATLRLTVIEHTLHHLHRPPPGRLHPELPDRLDAAAAALRAAPFADQLDWTSTEQLGRASEDMVVAMARVHSEEHLVAIRETSARGGGGFDADTYCAPGSWQAVIDGTSAWLEATSLAARGAGPALALARPPGHHATRDTPMGFCLVNFACAAAADYLATNPSGRISLLDWDVHHGNGVASIMADEPRVRYCSTHEQGGFPRTGIEADVGAHGNLLHLPLPGGSGGATYLKRLRQEAVPFLFGQREGDEWKPDLLLICAGFDALDSDPLAGLTLQPDDFGASVRALVVEGGFPREKIALGLEGGYDLDAISGMPAGLAKTCEALLAEP